MLDKDSQKGIQSATTKKLFLQSCSYMIFFLSTLTQHMFPLRYCLHNIQCVLLSSWRYSFNQSFLSTFCQSCCVTALTNCSSHGEEPACPLSVIGIRGTLSTLRFSLWDVSQPQQKQACPNTGCGLLYGKLIELFTANHHSMPTVSFSVFGGQLQNNILLLHIKFFFFLDGLGWLARCVIVGLVLV